MSYKKFVRESERTNEFKYAKIIAIVDKEGAIKDYDWTLTQYADDFFADPEDRKKYKAITLKPVVCESMTELKEKFRVALEYLRLGAALTKPEAKKTMKRLKEGKGSAEWRDWINDSGMLDGIPADIPDAYLRCKYAPHHTFKASPRARGVRADRPNLHVVDENLKEAEYKIGDRIQLRIINRSSYAESDGFVMGKKIELPPLDVWVTVEACHWEMWTKDVHWGEYEKGEEGDYTFVQHEILGRMDDETLIEFNPKHVIEHLPAKRFKDMTPVEQAKWFTSGSTDSDSDHQDLTRLPYRTTIYGRAGPGMTNINVRKIFEKLDIVPKLLEKIKLERQSDADLPESEPKPEPCDVVQPAEVAAEPEAPPECIVPPRAPRAPRHRRPHP